MHARTARLWFVAGLAHVALGALALLAAAAPAPIDARAALVLLASGLAMLAASLALGILPAFLRRDWFPPLLSLAAIGLALLGDLAWIGTALAGRPEGLRLLMALHGAALALAALHAPLLATSGARWKGGESLFAPAQPFRQADGVAAGAIAFSLAGLLAGGLLLVAAPREQPHAALAVLLFGAILPAALAAVVFALPRESRARWSGATLASFALLLFAAGALAFAVAFARPLIADMRAPAFGALLAWLLLGVAAWRQRGASGERPTRARPLLAGALVAGALGAIALVLAVPAGVPNNLLPLALAAHLVAALLALAGGALLAAPLLLPGESRATRWPRWVAAALIAGLFLIAPAFQYERSAFPGALVLALATLALVAGLGALARIPSSPRRAMRRR